MTKAVASCLILQFPCDLAGWQCILVLVTKYRNFYVAFFIFQETQISSLSDPDGRTGFRAGLSGPAQQARTGPGRRPLMLSSICDWKPPNARFALRSHRVLCAQPRRQHQKLRPAGTELLAEFRSQARIPSMRAHSKTVFISIFRGSRA